MKRRTEPLGCHVPFVSRQNPIPSLFLLVNYSLTHAVLNLFFFRFLFFLRGAINIAAAHTSPKTMIKWENILPHSFDLFDKWRQLLFTLYIQYIKISQSVLIAKKMVGCYEKRIYWFRIALKNSCALDSVNVSLNWLEILFHPALM